MPKYTLSENSYQQIPEGSVLGAEVLEVKEKKMPFTDDNGNDIFKVEFKFLITDDEFSGRNIWGNTPTTFSENPDCKLRSWTQEILQLDAVPVGFSLDTEHLVGMPCRVQIGHRIQTKGDQKIVRDYVADVIRARTRAPSSADVF